MDADEILDGLALWDEHKPQSGQDWVAVARRSIKAEDYDPAVGSPIFQALYAAVEALEVAEAALTHIQPYAGLLAQYLPEATHRVAAAREKANAALSPESRDSQETT